MLNISSTDLKTCISNGQTKFDGPFQDVADYIYERKLYNAKNPDQGRNLEDQLTL